MSSEEEYNYEDESGEDDDQQADGRCFEWLDVAS